MMVFVCSCLEPIRPDRSANALYLSEPIEMDNIVQMSIDRIHCAVHEEHCSTE